MVVSKFEDLTHHSKILIRNFTFKQAYQEWLSTEVKNEIEFLKQEYEMYLLGKETPRILLEKNEGYASIIWQDLRHLHVSNILDYLRARVVKLGYYNSLSDVRTEYFDGGIKLSYERYILKPHNKTLPQGDNFGIIHLENCSQPNSKFNMIKILVTTHQKASPFHQLMRELLMR